MSLPAMTILREFPNEYYVETGIYRGDSIQWALEAGCFKNIIGLEISYEMLWFCKNRFDLYFNPKGNLKLYECDSANELGLNIGHIAKTKPITFFLDAHWQMFEGIDRGRNPFPLLKELQQLAEKREGNDTIIIDDFLYLTHPDVTGWNRKKIFEAIYKINPNYTIRLISNPIVENLLIAIP